MEALLPFVSMNWVLVVGAGFGLIIGSFLNVFLYRFHTGKSLAGRSHCLSCAAPIRPYDLVPLFSYLFLRGRCRKCGSYIPIRYCVVEVGTALLFAVSIYVAADLRELVLLLLVSILAVVIVVYDIRHLIIPDEFTALLTLIALGNLGYEYLLLGSAEVVLMTLAAAFAGVTFFYGLWFVSRGAWIGFGDVKLIFPLGILAGPALVFSLVVYSFWIGAAISVLLVGLAKLQRGKLRLHLPMGNITIKSAVPFAPFLIAGCLLTLFTHYNVLNFFSSLS